MISQYILGQRDIARMELKIELTFGIKEHFTILGLAPSSVWVQSARVQQSYNKFCCLSNSFLLSLQQNVIHKYPVILHCYNDILQDLNVWKYQKLKCEISIVNRDKNSQEKFIVPILGDSLYQQQYSD